MSKSLVRLVALLLVPLLVADPATAVAFSSLPVSPVQHVAPAGAQFQEQALEEPLLSSHVLQRTPFWTVPAAEETPALDHRLSMPGLSPEDSAASEINVFDLMAIIANNKNLATWDKILGGRVLVVPSGPLTENNLVTHLQSKQREQKKPVACVGLDPAISKQTVQEHPSFQSGVVTRIPFGDNSVGTVVSIGFFNSEYFDFHFLGMQRDDFPDRETFYQAAAREIKRVLKDEGRFFVNIGVSPNPDFLRAFKDAGFVVHDLSNGGYLLINHKDSGALVAPPAVGLAAEQQSSGQLPGSKRLFLPGLPIEIVNPESLDIRGGSGRRALLEAVRQIRESGWLNLHPDSLRSTERIKIERVDADSAGNIPAGMVLGPGYYQITVSWEPYPDEIAAVMIHEDQHHLTNNARESAIREYEDRQKTPYISHPWIGPYLNPGAPPSFLLGELQSSGTESEYLLHLWNWEGQGPAETVLLPGTGLDQKKHSARIGFFLAGNRFLAMKAIKQLKARPNLLNPEGRQWLTELESLWKSLDSPIQTRWEPLLDALLTSPDSELRELGYFYTGFSYQFDSHRQQLYQLKFANAIAKEQNVEILKALERATRENLDIYDFLVAAKLRQLARNRINRLESSAPPAPLTSRGTYYWGKLMLRILYRLGVRKPPRINGSGDAYDTELGMMDSEREWIEFNFTPWWPWEVLNLTFRPVGFALQDHDISTKSPEQVQRRIEDSRVQGALQTRRATIQNALSTAGKAIVILWMSFLISVLVFPHQTVPLLYSTRFLSEIAAMVVGAGLLIGSARGYIVNAKSHLQYQTSVLPEARLTSSSDAAPRDEKLRQDAASLLQTALNDIWQHLTEGTSIILPPGFLSRVSEGKRSNAIEEIERDMATQAGSDNAGAAVDKAVDWAYALIAEAILMHTGDSFPRKPRNYKIRPADINSITDELLSDDRNPLEQAFSTATDVWTQIINKTKPNSIAGSNLPPNSLRYWWVRAFRPEVSEEEAIKQGRKGLRMEIPALITLSLAMAYLPALVVILAGFYLAQIILQVIASHRPNGPPLSLLSLISQPVVFAFYLLPAILHPSPVLQQILMHFNLPADLWIPLGLAALAGAAHALYDQQQFEVSSIKAALVRNEGIKRELENEVSQLKHASETDSLTGLFRREIFDDQLKRALARAKRGHPFSVIMLDVDKFKEINDVFGHQAGDEILRYISSKLRMTDRIVLGRGNRSPGPGGRRTAPQETVARYGGEEFVILLEDTDLKAAEEKANSLLKLVEAKFSEIASQKAKEGIVPEASALLDRAITVSMGVAAYTLGDTAETVMKRADEALYKAKGAGRNNVQVESASDSETPQPAAPKRAGEPPSDEDDVNIADVGDRAPSHKQVTNPAIKKFYEEGLVKPLPDDERTEVLQLIRKVYPGLADLIEQARQGINIYICGDDHTMELAPGHAAHAGISTGAIYIARGRYRLLKNKGIYVGESKLSFLAGRVAHEAQEIMLWRREAKNRALSFEGIRKWIRDNIAEAKRAGLKPEDSEAVKLHKLFHAQGVRFEHKITGVPMNSDEDNILADPDDIIITSGLLDELPSIEEYNSILAIAKRAIRKWKDMGEGLTSAWEATDRVLYNSGLVPIVESPYWGDREDTAVMLELEKIVRGARDIRTQIRRKSFQNRIKLPNYVDQTTNWPEGTMTYRLGDRAPGKILQLRFNTDQPMIITAGREWFILEQEDEENWILIHPRTQTQIRIATGVEEIIGPRELSPIARKAPLIPSVSTFQTTILITKEGVTISDLHSNLGTSVRFLPPFNALANEQLVNENRDYIDYLVNENIINLMIGRSIEFLVDQDGRIIQGLPSEISRSFKDLTMIKVEQSRRGYLSVASISQVIFQGPDFDIQYKVIPENLWKYWENNNIADALQAYNFSLTPRSTIKQDELPGILFFPLIHGWHALSSLTTHVLHPFIYYLLAVTFAGYLRWDAFRQNDRRRPADILLSRQA